MAGAHIIRLTRKQVWRWDEWVQVSDAPRASDMAQEIASGQARIEQTGTVDAKPGTYPVTLVAIDPSGNRSAPLALTVVRE